MRRRVSPRGAPRIDGRRPSMRPDAAGAPRARSLRLVSPRPGEPTQPAARRAERAEHAAPAVGRSPVAELRGNAPARRRLGGLDEETQPPGVRGARPREVLLAVVAGANLVPVREMAG